MSARLVTTRTRILGLLERWRQQYPPELHEKRGAITEHGRITRRLAALDLSRTSAAAVEAIIGNDSWTDIQCEQCHAHIERAVEFMEELTDWDQRSWLVCAACLRSAMDLLVGDYDGEETRP